MYVCAYELMSGKLLYVCMYVCITYVCMLCIDVCVIDVCLIHVCKLSFMAGT